MSAMTVEKKSEKRISIRFDLASGPRIGPGKIALLKAIAETGSISAGARQLGMSYKKAWLLIDAFNSTFREPVLSTETGGEQGGGATLTETGREVLRLFGELEAEAASATEATRKAFDQLVKTAPSKPARKK